MRLQLHVELVVFLHAGSARSIGLDRGTEFLEMHADAIEGNGASAIGTLDSCHNFMIMTEAALIEFEHITVMRGRTVALDDVSLKIGASRLSALFRQPLELSERNGHYNLW